MKTITLTIDFTEEEASQFFESNNIKVFEKPTATLFGDGRMVKMVENPANSYTYTLERAFVAVMAARTKQMMLQETNRLTIYHTLNKLN